MADRPADIDMIGLLTRLDSSTLGTIVICGILGCIVLVLVLGPKRATAVAMNAVREVQYQEQKAHRKRRLIDASGGRPSKRASGSNQPMAFSEDTYASNVCGVIPAEVTLLSGCKDSQTSADLANGNLTDVNYLFALGQPCGSTDAGGACTIAFLETMREEMHLTHVELLTNMRIKMKHKRCTQIPELSSSRALAPEAVFTITPTARSKALLIGINYKGQRGSLRGCINDAMNLKRWLAQQGFSERENAMRVLVDDGQHTPPTRANIVEAIKWLVRDARAGDHLWFSFSGHGAQVRDDNGDEADGLDETIVPLDYQRAGQIRDDELLQRLVLPLPQGAKLTALMDCCHSGTALDLPYICRDGGAGMDFEMVPNPAFDLELVMNMASEMCEAYQRGGVGAAFVAGLASDASKHVLRDLARRH